jgi:hypothetical protein
MHLHRIVVLHLHLGGGGFEPRSNAAVLSRTLDGTPMFVAVATDSAFRADPPKFLFQGPNQGSLATFYSWRDLTKDGKRLVFWLERSKARIRLSRSC